MYVGSRSALSASRSCVNPDAPRNLRTFFPKHINDRCRLDIVLTTGSIDDKSMDYESSQRGRISEHSADAQHGRETELEGARVLILTGQFKGQEGVCLGKGSADNLWAVSPDSTYEVLSLVFEKDFGLLVDLSADPNQN